MFSHDTDLVQHLQKLLFVSLTNKNRKFSEFLVQSQQNDSAIIDTIIYTLSVEKFRLQALMIVMNYCSYKVSFDRSPFLRTIEIPFHSKSPYNNLINIIE